MRTQPLSQMRASQKKGRRFDRNEGVTLACVAELRRRRRTAQWISKKTGYPLKAVKNALHHLQCVVGGVTSEAPCNGTARIYALYSAPVRNVDPNDFSRAGPISVGRGSRWWAEFV